MACAGQTTQPEAVTFQLTGGLQRHSSLSFWSTSETHQFVQLPDLVVDSDNTISFTAMPDTIYTVSSTTGQQKGGFEIPIPPGAPFPFPYADDFNSYSVDNEAKYFADDGGCFLIAEAPPGSDQHMRGMVLQQFVINQAGVNAWVPDTPPITVIGNPNWTDYRVTVDVRMEDSTASPFFANLVNKGNGMCLDVNGKETSSGASINTYECVTDYNEQVRDTTFVCVALSPAAVALRCRDATADRATDRHVRGHRTLPARYAFIYGVKALLHCLHSHPMSIGVVGLCQVTCDASSPNQRWLVNAADSTIRLAAAVNWCMTVAPSSDSNIVYLGPCVAGATEQQWATEFFSNQYAGMFGRLNEGGDRTRQGYGFTLSQAGAYAVMAGEVTLASGSVDVPVVGSWHTLSLLFASSTITAFINGTQVASVNNATFASGLVSLVSNWGIAYFDNFSVLGQ